MEQKAQSALILKGMRGRVESWNLLAFLLQSEFLTNGQGSAFTSVLPGSRHPPPRSGPAPAPAPTQAWLIGGAPRGLL